MISGVHVVIGHFSKLIFLIFYTRLLVTVAQVRVV